MKIAIDITQVIYGTGVSVYTKNLVKNLLEVDKKNEYVLFGGYLRRKDDLLKFTNNLKGNFETRLFPIPPTLQNILWNYLHVVKVENIVGRVDIFHSSDWSQPPASAFKITTVHDLVPLIYPELSDPRIVNTHKKRLFWVKREVNKVIVPSKSTYNDLVKVGFDGQKVVVIPEAIDEIYRPMPISTVENIKKKYRIFGNYILAIGLTERKNITNIVKAFEIVKTSVKNPIKLVVVGFSYKKFEPPHGVIVLGHVPTEDMPALYSGAELLVYPSLYEGFGLPILEAFACKTPVITSNYGSMKEVGGDAAFFVNPKDANEIASGVLKIIKDRGKYVRLGYRRSKEFNWKIVAHETCKIYNSIIG